MQQQHASGSSRLGVQMYGTAPPRHAQDPRSPTSDQLSDYSVSDDHADGTWCCGLFGRKKKRAPPFAPSTIPRAVTASSLHLHPTTTESSGYPVTPPLGQPAEMPMLQYPTSMSPSTSTSSPTFLGAMEKQESFASGLHAALSYHELKPAVPSKQ